MKKNGKKSVGNAKKMIEGGLFCTVQVSTYAEFGVKSKDTVYIAGDVMVGTDENNPYVYEKMFIVNTMDKKGHIKIEDKPFLCRGHQLKACTKPRQEKLQAIMEEDFKAPEEAECAA